jgi:hypothetical protein
MRDIIGDMLMNKVYYSPTTKKVYLRKLHKRTKRLIKDWYRFADYLNSFPRVDLVVYRGVKNMNPTKPYHVQPIPFSTCIDIINATEWVIPHSNHSFIMCINVSSDIPYTFTNNVHEGHEVILPAGCLRLETDSSSSHQQQQQGINILYYRLVV